MAGLEGIGTKVVQKMTHPAIAKWPAPFILSANLLAPQPPARRSEGWPKLPCDWQGFCYCALKLQAMICFS